MLKKGSEPLSARRPDKRQGLHEVLHRGRAAPSDAPKWLLAATLKPLWEKDCWLNFNFVPEASRKAGMRTVMQVISVVPAAHVAGVSVRWFGLVVWRTTLNKCDPSKSWLSPRQCSPWLGGIVFVYFLKKYISYIIYIIIIINLKTLPADSYCVPLSSLPEMFVLLS